MQQPKFTGTPRERIKAMRVITIALVTGMLVFAAVILGIIQVQESLLNKESGSIKNILFIAAISIAAICIVAAHLLYQKKLTESKNSMVALQDKLNHYTSSLILYHAICEAAGLFSIIIFFLTGNYYLLVVTGVMALLMISKIPTAQKLINELNLDGNDQQELI